MNSFKKFDGDKLCIFIVQQTIKKLVKMVKYQMVMQVLKTKFKMKNMGDYHDHYC